MTPDSQSFKDRQVLVVGASSGIGAGIAQAFAAHGAQVTVTGATAAEVAAARQDPTLAGAQVRALDVRDGDAVTALFTELVQLDVLVNCAGVIRRGAGPMDASLFGRGAGEGLGVHICTGPVYVKGAEEGDVLEVRIIDVSPRPSANPKYKGKSFGVNAAAWWGFHFKELITEPKDREVITIYEIDANSDRNWAQAVYNFRWTPQTDPFGVMQDRKSTRLNSSHQI